MAQPNVAREPSMEEILASIRRIIESNDPDNAAESNADMPRESEAAASHIEDAPIERTASVSHSIREDDEDRASDDDEPHEDIELTVDGSFGEAADEDDDPAPQAPPKPASLADVAARVRAGLAAPSSSAAPASPVMTLHMRDMAQGGSETKSESPTKAEEPAVKPEAAPPTLEPKVAEPASQTVPAGTAVATVSMQPQAIVSEETQDRVARSFDELASALSTEPTRSLDEIAEEMLRPMLRAWLDDNLPPLVERLVREEIERVARGPRG